MKNIDDRVYWIAAQILCGIGTRKAHRVFNSFSHPKQLFSLSEREWTSLELLSKADRAKFCEIPKLLEKANEIYEKSIAKDIQILTPDDDRYPKRLLNIYSPALAIYAYGNLDVLSRKLIVALVGTRKPDGYGTRACRLLSQELAEYGIPSVSGLAYGIDSVAHRRAVAVNGETVAVLGNGMGRIYPSENRKLAESIVESGGLVLSEFQLDEKPMPYNFPLRNRIISGLSDAVVVIQGARGSGSLITAAQCISQNRLLFAVPGNIFSELSAASNWLISQGAFVCSDVESILYEFPNLSLDKNDRFSQLQNISRAASPATAKKLQNTDTDISDNSIENKGSIQPSFGSEAPSYLSGEQTKVFSALTGAEMYVEQIADNCGLQFFDTSSILTQLELLGLVRELPGGLYSRVYKK